MEWVTIKDSNKKIVKYQLNDNIYIKKRYGRGIYGNLSEFVLYVFDRSVFAGRLKDAKIIGLKYAMNRNKPTSRSEIKYHTDDNTVPNDKELIGKYTCQVFNCLHEIIAFIIGDTYDEVLNKYDNKQFDQVREF